MAPLQSSLQSTAAELASRSLHTQVRFWSPCIQRAPPRPGVLKWALFGRHVHACSSADLHCFTREGRGVPLTRGQNKKRVPSPPAPGKPRRLPRAGRGGPRLCPPALRPIKRFSKAFPCCLSAKSLPAGPRFVLAVPERAAPPSPGLTGFCPPRRRPRQRSASPTARAVTEDGGAGADVSALQGLASARRDG